MSKDFTAPVKGGYDADDPKHRRNWRALMDYLRSPFVTTGQIEDLAITSAKIGDAQIESAKIESLSADKITAGTMTADVVVAGTMTTGAAPDQRVEINSGGIHAFDAANEETVTIPVTGDPYFKGTIIAEALELNGNAIINSTGNFIAPGADLQIADSDSVPDPSIAPGLAWDYPTLALTGTWSGTAGAAYHDTVAGRYYIVTLSDGVNWYDDSTGAFIGSFNPSGPGDIVGITKGGTYWWLARVYSSASYLDRYDDGEFTGENVDTVDRSFDLGSAQYGLTWDDANDRLIVLRTKRDTAPPHPVLWTVYWFTEARAADGGDGEATGGTSYLRDVHYDGTYLWAAGSGEVDAYTLNYAARSAARTTSQDFLSVDGDSQGMMEGDTFLASMRYGTAAVIQYGTWFPSTTYFHARHTWYDSGLGGETLGSPAATLAARDRAQLTVSVGATIPDGVDRIRVYLEESASATPSGPTSSNFKLQDTATTSPVTLTTYNGAGAAIPVANTTSGVTPGALTTGTGGFSLNGDGEMVLPSFAAAPGTPSNGQIYYDTVTLKAYIYDGSTWNALW